MALVLRLGRHRRGRDHRPGLSRAQLRHRVHRRHAVHASRSTRHRGRPRTTPTSCARRSPTPASSGGQPDRHDRGRRPRSSSRPRSSPPARRPRSATVIIDTVGGRPATTSRRTRSAPAGARRSPSGRCIGLRRVPGPRRAVHLGATSASGRCRSPRWSRWPTTSSSPSASIAWSGFEVTPATVTGLLTILGFSLYDTVVVFDKVAREHQGPPGEPGRPTPRRPTWRVNQTLVRSINTSIVALIPIGAILYVGARAARRQLAEGPRARAVRRHGGRRLLLGLHRHRRAGAPEVRRRPRSCSPRGAPRPGPAARPTRTRRCRRSPRTCRSTTRTAATCPSRSTTTTTQPTSPRPGSRRAGHPRRSAAAGPSRRPARPVGDSPASGRQQPTRQPKSKRGKK